MKLPISILTTSFMASLAFSSCHASGTKFNTAQASQDTIHAMLHPDSNTIFMDEAGNKIDNKKFMGAMKSGKYTFIPDMKDGKVVSIKLKTTEKTIAMGSKAPEFSGKDMVGKTFDLNALKGKTVILNFWFTSCAPCMQEIPDLNGIVEKYKNDTSVVFLAITYDSAQQVKSFLARKDFKFKILVDQAGIIKQYGISGYPTSMIIDKTGSVVFSLTTYDGTNVQQLDGVIGALKGMK